MVELTKEEKLIRDNFYISEVPAGNTVEIICNGKKLVKREGDKEIERLKE